MIRDITLEEYTGWTKSKRLRVIKRLVLESLMEKYLCSLESAIGIYKGFSKQKKKRLRVRKQVEILRQLDY